MPLLRRRTVVDDVADLCAWREGDREAGRRLIDHYTPVLMRFFRNKAWDATEDLVQQTFMRCIEHRGDVRVPERFRTYILTVARRELLAHYRKKTSDRARFDPLTTSVFDLDPRPSTVAADREERRLIAEAMRRIPVKFQIALELFYWQDMQGPALAEVLEVPEGTVRSRLKRGRELLATQLADLARDRGLLARATADLDTWVP